MLYAIMLLSIVFWPLLAAFWAAQMVIDVLTNVTTAHEYARFLRELERALAQNHGET